jgi:hypothetical protein
MKDLIKSVRIWIVQKIRDFLGINREIAQIKRDITAIEIRELNRDQQYPIEDLEILAND